MVDADVDDPVAEPGGGARLGEHRLAVEFGVGRVGRSSVLAHFGLVFGQEGLLVEALQGGEEAVCRAHHLLGAIPRHVEPFQVGPLGRRHVCDCGGHVEHGGWGRRERFELGQRLLVKPIQRRLRLDDRRLGGGELASTHLLKLAHPFGHLRHLCLLNRGEGSLLFGDERLLAHLLEQRVRLLLLLLHHDRLLAQLELHVRHLAFGVSQLDEAVGEAHAEQLGARALAPEHELIQIDQLEERLWSRVHVPPSLQLVARGGDAHRLVDECHVVGARIPQLGCLHLDLLEEARGDGDQCLLGPRKEPVDRRAVGERREPPAAVTEAVAHGRHAADHVQVGSHLIDKEAPEVLA